MHVGRIVDGGVGVSRVCACGCASGVRRCAAVGKPTHHRRRARNRTDSRCKSPMRSMSKPPKQAQRGDGVGDHEETKRRQRQFSLSHPDFAPPPGSSPAPAPAPRSKVSRPRVSRRTSVYTESHPDFAAAAAAALVDESSEEDEIPGYAAAPEPLARVFTEPGSLGLKLNEVEGTGRAKVVKVNAGSQGEQHPQTVGMLVKSVSGTDVSGISYKEVLGMLKSKAKERPLTLCFEAAVAQVSPPAAASEQGPDPAAAGQPRSMSKASKMAQRGDGVDDHEETKRRQRQFSLSHPDFAPPPGSSPAPAPAPEAAAASKPRVSRRTSVYTESHPDFAAAAAAALVDESSEEDDYDPPPGQPDVHEPEPELEPGSVEDTNLIQCTFRKGGSLGMKLNATAEGAVIVRVNPGSQAEDHAQLRAGLVIRRIGDRNVTGMDYASVLSLLKQAKQRPVTIDFSSSESLAGADSEHSPSETLGTQVHPATAGMGTDAGRQRWQTAVAQAVVLDEAEPNDNERTTAQMQMAADGKASDGGRQRWQTAVAQAVVLEEAEPTDNKSAASEAGAPHWTLVRGVSKSQPLVADSSLGEEQPDEDESASPLATEYESIISSYTPSPRRDDPPPAPSAVTLGAWSSGLAAFAVRTGLSAGYSQHDAHKEALEMASLAYEAAEATTDIETGAENDKCKRSQLIVERALATARPTHAGPAARNRK